MRNAYGSNPFPESKVIGDWIKNYTQPEDKIVVACSEPQILFYAQRASVTGHIYTYPLVDNGKYMTQLQDEFIGDLKKLPKISVFTYLGTSWLSRDQTGRVFKEIEQMHQKNYNLIGVAEAIPTRATNTSPIEWRMNYHWQKDAISYYNQRMQGWQQNNAKLQAAGRPTQPPPGLLTIWERKKEISSIESE